MARWTVFVGPRAVSLWEKHRTMNTTQLEITLKVRPCLRSAVRRQHRMTRAHWWFAQMRRVVDQAGTWQRPSEAGNQLELASAKQSRRA